MHIVDRYLQTLREFGVRNDNAGLDYFIPEKDQVKIEEIPIVTSAEFGSPGCWGQA